MVGELFMLEDITKHVPKEHIHMMEEIYMFDTERFQKVMKQCYNTGRAYIRGLITNDEYHWSCTQILKEDYTDVVLYFERDLGEALVNLECNARWVAKNDREASKFYRLGALFDEMRQYEVAGDIVFLVAEGGEEYKMQNCFCDCPHYNFDKVNMIIESLLPYGISLPLATETGRKSTYVRRIMRKCNLLESDYWVARYDQYKEALEFIN